MDIYFLRHANAGEPKFSPAKDEKRPIDKLGIEQSHDVGRALAALDVSPDVIISSPLRRATQTAAVVANELGYEDKVITDVALRPEANYEKFQDLLRRHGRREAIMLVGHNPSITDFLAKIIAKSGCEAQIDFKKGAVARVETGRRSATLDWFFTPRLAREIQTAAVSANKSQPKTSRK